MSTLCIITALPAEAAPLVAHRSLCWQRAGGFHYAENDGIALIVGGIGKLAASVSLARFCQWRGDVRAIINIGIGGCDRPVGTAVLAHTIEDAGSGWRFHPQMPPARALPTLDSATVVTVDRPAGDYREDAVFDMEAAGVAAAARAFVGAQALHCLKVISDGPDAPMEAIDKARVERLIGDRLTQLDALIDYTLRDGAGDGQEAQQLAHIDALAEQLAGRIRHSATQRHQLQRQLQRIVALGGELPEPASLHCPDARALARLLDGHLASLGVRY